MSIAGAARQQQFMAKAEQVSDSLIHSLWLPWAIIALGIVVRLNQFAQGRALWLDEIRLALNILDRSFADLTLPLNYDQGSPVGFLWLEKLAVEIFGPSDALLRLVPLVASILALLLFYPVARRFLRPRAMLLALLFFAIAGPVIYYGSEVKQYSSDVLVTVVVLWIGSELLTRKLTPILSILYTLLGAGLMWLAHPAIFCLAGTGLACLMYSLWKKDRPRTLTLVIIGAVWLVSFAAVYVVSLSKLTGSDYLRTFWAFGFMPLDPVDLPQWLAEALVTAVGFAASTSLAGLATFLVLIGGAAYFKQHWGQLGLLIGPIIFTLLASAVQVYPFANRMILFITPLVIILLAKGTDQLVDWLTAQHKTIPDGWIRMTSSVALLGLLLYFPLWVLGTNLKQPLLYNSNGLEDFTAVMAYLEAHIEPGDTVYAYYNAVLPFRYYAPQYHLEDVQLVIGVGDEPKKMDLPVEAFLDELDGLKSQAPERIWLLFSHVGTRDGLNEEQLYLTYLDRIGQRTDALIASGSSAYLYDLSLSPEA